MIVSPDAGGAFGPDYDQHFADAGIADRDGVMATGPRGSVGVAVGCVAAASPFA